MIGKKLSVWPTKFYIHLDATGHMVNLSFSRTFKCENIFLFSSSLLLTNSICANTTVSSDGAVAAHAEWIKRNKNRNLYELKYSFVQLRRNNLTLNEQTWHCFLQKQGRIIELLIGESRSFTWLLQRVSRHCKEYGVIENIFILKNIAYTHQVKFISIYYL